LEVQVSSSDREKNTTIKILTFVIKKNVESICVMQIQTINSKTNKIKRVEETNTPRLFTRFDPN